MCGLHIFLGIVYFSDCYCKKFSSKLASKRIRLFGPNRYTAKKILSNGRIAWKLVVSDLKHSTYGS
jgi:hypothetical protein